MIAGLQAMEKKDKPVQEMSINELEQQLVSLKKEEYLSQLKTQVSFLDAYLNRDLKVVDDKFIFQDCDDENVKKEWSLEEGFNFFRTAMPPLHESRKQRNRYNDLSPANSVVASAMDLLIQEAFGQDRNFLQQIEKFEHKIMILNNLDDEDRMILQIERCKIFQKMRHYSQEEKEKFKREIQNDKKGFREIARPFKITDPDLFIEHLDKLATLREALESSTPSAINGCYREETTARYSLSSFIAVNIAKLKNEIKKRDIKKFSSPESNSSKSRPGRATEDEKCIIS